MNTKKQTIQSRIIEQIISGIIKLTDKMFDLYSQTAKWNEKSDMLEFENRHTNKASAMKKAGWFFLLFILMPLIACLDYTSVSAFIDYLAKSSGGMIGGVIQLVGVFIFLLLEIAIGWLLNYAKDKPMLKLFGIICAILITIAPSVLVYVTYYINPDKTQLLFVKTVVLMVISILFHALLFLLIGEIWEGIIYYKYRFTRWLHNMKNPAKLMTIEKDKLQKEFIDFDMYVMEDNNNGAKHLNNNRAWYLKQKFKKGDIERETDLSDYNPEVSYAPSQS